MPKNLHNNPVVFWLLAAIAVGSFLFAIYTFEITKPSRNLIYRIYSKTFSIPDGMNRINIDGIEGAFRPTSGYIKEIFIWNNGNLEIEPAYLLQPIKIAFEENERIIEVSGINVSNQSYKIEFNDRKIEIKFEKLLPKAGFNIRYFSNSNTNHPQIEGLIADPIRGASTIKNASIIWFAPQKEFNKSWIWESFDILFIPVTLFSLISAVHDIKPVSRASRLIRNIIYYSLIIVSLLYATAKIYDFMFATPPI